jgi:hypothetical protein
MTIDNPSIILRLGSHSEKFYFEKVINFIDGYIIAANLIESTPAASASLVFRFSGKNTNTPYFLDPMTYAFGAYRDPMTGRVQHDLDWIKSNQKRGETYRNFKRSYRSLGETFGGPFADAVSDPKNANAAISPSNLGDASVITSVCENVVRYQLDRMPGIFAKEMNEDPGAAKLTQNLPRPQAVMAPYFYVEPYEEDAWINVNLHLMEGTLATRCGLPVHGVLCMDELILLESEKINRIADAVVKTGINGIWLWFSKFNEDEINTDSYAKLLTLRCLVEKLSSKLDVFNMHGGFFSLALSKYGLKGVSHGVGYGEQKDVVPVVGQAIPVVRYYLPALHRRLGVPDIERCFRSLGINEPYDFYEPICNCAICRGVVSNSVNQFRLFGEMQSPKPGKQKSTQTPAAAKRCRFHFLLSRIRERDWVKNVTSQEISDSLRTANQKWSSQPTVRRYCTHLEAWMKVLTA